MECEGPVAHNKTFETRVALDSSVSWPPKERSATVTHYVDSILNLWGSVHFN